MRRLVLLRHGLTPWNAERRFQGHADIELAETGHLQAKAAAEALAAFAPAAVWSSDLLRAAQTAEYVAEAAQLVPVVDARLREVHVGDFQGLTYAEAVARHGDPPWEYADHGGESDADLAARVVEALRHVAASVGEDQSAVVVSHGHALRVAVPAFLGWPAATAERLAGLDNCGWVELLDRGGADAWRLTAYNRVAPIS